MSRIYPCVYCTENGYCKKYSDEEVTSWCVQSPCKDERPSNADKIRSMSDEELAKFCGKDMDACPPGCDSGKCIDELYAHGEGTYLSDKQCMECWLDWLRQEARHETD